MIENAEQQQAIQCLDKQILVLAGAGSGKTKTLIDKIKFYINTKKVNPKNILGITFMRDAVHEIKDRLIEYSDKSNSYQTELRNSGYDEKVRKKYIDKNSILKSLTVRTFHSLCYSILKENGAGFFDNRFKLLTDDQMAFKIEDANVSSESVNSLFRKSVISACEHEDSFLLDLEQYLIENYFDKRNKGLRDPKEYSNQQNYICCDGTIVKSKSEQRIVDWFISKGYAIEYEPLEVASSFKFKPDFKLSTKEFYIEHRSSLSSQLNDKLKALKESGKPVFVTEEDWMHDSKKIESELMNILRNVFDGNYTANFSKEFDNRFRTLDIELSTFFKEIKQAYELAQSQNIDLEAIKKLDSDLFKHKRIKKFYELFPVVWKYYEALKQKNSVIDFNDLISLTIKLFEQNDKIKIHYQEKFKCILVDEFQDVDPAQVKLLKHLIHPESDLFCVGDDWQSIYGFRGSDVNYIIDFTSHFPDSTVLKLKYNFRSSDSIVQVGNEIIKNNKNRVDKEVLALKKSDQKVVLFQSNTNEDIVQFIEDKINLHIHSDRINPKDIMVLGRRKDHYNTLYKALADRKIKFSTIHKSKGLEAKVIFITGLKHGKGGFPDTWLSDSIYQVIKKTDKEILLEEERRLFYVAITRAKDFLYLISENGNQSQFIDELPKSFIDEILNHF